MRKNTTPWSPSRREAFNRWREKSRTPKVIAERFWKRVRKLGPNDCWEWLGYCAPGFGPTAKAGHGTFCLPGGVPILAHRFSWELHNGPIPEGKRVCHSCDNPPCCNPAHLFVGTAKDNTQDCIKKGRFSVQRGLNNGKHKLTPEQVVEIRKRYVHGKFGTPRLASMFGVKAQTIAAVINRITWKHVP